MPPTKRAPKRKPKAPADPAPPSSVLVRGLTAADHAAIDRACARRSAQRGGTFVSANSALLEIIRVALAAEDASDASRTGGT